MALRAIFFDVGETLVNETRAWTLCVEKIGVTPLTFFAALGCAIERREHHRSAFELLGVTERVSPFPYERGDLYDDALPCLRELRGRGYKLGLAGNQPSQTEGFLRDAGLEVDVIGSSESWGLTKPDVAFFRRIVAEARCDPGEVAYVGDRVDNDVVPAAAAGLVSVFLRRGPWGFIQAGWPEADRAAIRIDSLAELPEALARV
jgi:FMN phosphatase YigB (HAD superfamily)